MALVTSWLTTSSVMKAASVARAREGEPAADRVVHPVQAGRADLAAVLVPPAEAHHHVVQAGQELVGGRSTSASVRTDHLPYSAALAALAGRAAIQRSKSSSPEALNTGFPSRSARAGGENGGYSSAPPRVMAACGLPSIAERCATRRSARAPSARPGPRFLAAQHLLQQVDAGELGEA
jgi:hypothetical protein